MFVFKFHKLLFFHEAARIINKKLEKCQTADNHIFWLSMLYPSNRLQISLICMLIYLNFHLLKHEAYASYVTFSL